MTSAERQRVDSFGHLEDGLRQAGPWYQWGPYVSERQWGTVREDYSPDGDGLGLLPPRPRPFARLPLGRGRPGRLLRHRAAPVPGPGPLERRDPILKERIFGLTGTQGNHGEDAKEYWWYLDAVPSHAWNRWRYHYPQAAFPYEDLIAENARRDRTQPEYELLDTGVFDDDRYWVVEVDYAKAEPDDLLHDGASHQRRARSGHPPRPAPRPGSATPGPGTRRRSPGPRWWPTDPVAGWSTTPPRASSSCWPDPVPTGPTRSGCSARTRPTPPASPAPRQVTPYPKDGIGEHVIAGPTPSTPAVSGTKAAWWYQVAVAAGPDGRAAPAPAPGGRQAPHTGQGAGPVVHQGGRPAPRPKPTRSTPRWRPPIHRPRPTSWP